MRTIVCTTGKRTTAFVQQVVIKPGGVRTHAQSSLGLRRVEAKHSGG